MELFWASKGLDLRIASFPERSSIMNFTEAKDWLLTLTITAFKLAILTLQVFASRNLMWSPSD